MTALCLMPPVVQPIPPKPELRLIPVFYQRQSRFDVREETPAERPRTVAVEVGGLKIRVELCGDGQRIDLIGRHGCGTDVVGSSQPMKTTNLGGPRTDAADVVVTEGGAALKLVEHGLTRAIDADIAAWRKELARLKTSKDWQRRAPKAVEELRDKYQLQRSADAEPAHITGYLADLTCGGVTQNNRLSALHCFFEYCRETLKTVRENPAASVKPTRADRGDGVREFELSEMQRIIGTATGHWRVACVLFATTALRRGAVFKGVRCGFFRPKSSALVLPDGFLKNKKAQVIALNSLAVSVLEEATRGRGPDEYIVPISFDQDTWLALLERAGVPHTDEQGRPAGTHSFRKGAAAALLEAGVHLKDIKELLGHSDIRLTERVYAKTAANRTLKRQAEAVKILEAVNPDVPAGCEPASGAVTAENADGGLTPNGEPGHDVAASDPMISAPAQPGSNARLPLAGGGRWLLPTSASTGGRAFLPGSAGGTLSGPAPTEFKSPWGHLEGGSEALPHGVTGLGPATRSTPGGEAAPELDPQTIARIAALPPEQRRQFWRAAVAWLTVLALAGGAAAACLILAAPEPDPIEITTDVGGLDE